MKAIANIYIILSFFIYIISCSIIYMIVRGMINQHFNKKVEKTKKQIKGEILKQLNCIKSDEAISKMDIASIREKLKQKHYIRAFNAILKEFNKDKNNHKYIKIYMENFEDIITINVKKYRKKDNILKTYLATLLGEYRISNYEISEFLLECINTKSIYLRISALESIARIGNISTFKRAIEYISKENKYINNKVFTDILNQFGGDKYYLDKYLINNLKNFSENIQKVVIEHFKNNKTDFVKEDLLNYLNDNMNKEVSISIIKYFSVIKYEKSKEKIIELLNNKDWEFRAVCATALKNYKCKESKNALTKSIKDKNWYVRYNSAITILEFSDDDLINSILYENDKYAKDILFYAMFINDKISYDDYLEESGKVEVGYQC
ncbi:HEAT repeat domain-containing protein [Paraclostridium tenue]|uniref:HEAT repeat domain-containing protein n=1 Tax=Paraclostridium tenue TaxID=1737 RepID=A0ABN1LZK7_9FIRM